MSSNVAGGGASASASSSGGKKRSQAVASASASSASIITTTTTNTSSNGVHPLISSMTAQLQMQQQQNNNHLGSAAAQAAAANSPLLLMALASAAWQSAHPALLQRLQQQLRQHEATQQQQQQPTQRHQQQSKEQKPVAGQKETASPPQKRTRGPSKIRVPVAEVEEKLRRNHNNNSAKASSMSPQQSSAAWSMPSSPPSSGRHSSNKMRKLKLYSADEKLDIIDYAKVIGNRAAGREFNVAESSIREWRKNEDRLRRQSQNATNPGPRPEINHKDLIRKLDDRLVKFIDANADVDWYAIRDRAQDLWPQIIRGSVLDGDADEMQITMGWITRFMKRNEHRVRRIAPPIIATEKALNGGKEGVIMNGGGGSISMVRKEHSFGARSEGGHSSDAKTATPPLLSHDTSANPSPASSPSPALATANNNNTNSTTTTSRRKCAQPRRAPDATLLLTPDAEKQSSKLVDSAAEKTQEEDECRPEKRRKLESAGEKEAAEKVKEAADPVIKVY